MSAVLRALRDLDTPHVSSADVLSLKMRKTTANEEPL